MIAILFTCMLKTTLIKSRNYIWISINLVEKNKIDSNKYRSIGESENEIVKILTKSKSCNFFRFKF